jgi:hypothetical protein
LQVLDFAHLDDGRFIVLLQTPRENKVHLAEASINLDEAIIRVEQVSKEDIDIRLV